MKSLARKAVLLLAPTAVGCAQFQPVQPMTAAVGEGNGTRVQPAARTSPDVARATAPQDPAPKGPATLPAPRPVEPAPTEVLEGPPTLASLEELADRVHPILRRDRAQVEAARGQAVQAGLFPNPRFDTNNPQVFNGRQTLLNTGFQQEIPVMAKKRLDQSAANEATRQAEINYAQDRASLHATIRQQFYVVLVDQKRVEVLTKTVDLVRKSYETGVGRQKGGDISTSDVRLLLVDYQRAEASLRSATAILDGDRKQLEAIVGAPGVIREPLQGLLTTAYPVFEEKELIEYVTRNHTQIEFALSVIRQNRVQLRRAEVEVYPNPTLGPAYQFGLVPGNDQFWFNITFAIPVWDRNQGAIRAAKANLAAAAASADNARLTLVNQVANILSQYLAARAVVERFETRGKGEPGILENANEAVRQIQIAYANKATDLATLLQAQRTAAQANSDYVDALQNLWNNATQLSGILQMERFP